jgi:5-oxoprolinase (ATP-hydrolysing)
MHEQVRHAGRWRSGDGAVRRIRFLAPMTAVIVASRRAVASFGRRVGRGGRSVMGGAGGETDRDFGGTDSAEMTPGIARPVLLTGRVCRSRL